VVYQSINQSISLLNVTDNAVTYIEKQCKYIKMAVNISVQHADEEIISQEAGFSFSPCSIN